MKLSKNLRPVLIRQFREGASISYLASLYKIREDRVEDVIRMALVVLSEETTASVSGDGAFKYG